MNSDSLIIRAARKAAFLHSGQFRKYWTGVPYYNHLSRVAGMVAAHPLSTCAMVAAAFLHDTLEDTSYTEAEMREEFGDEVTDLVVGMTNISKKFPCLSRKERKEMDRNRLALSPIEVKIIKSCDRADNLDDMRGAPFDFQKLYLGESYELYGCIKGGDEVSDNLLSQALSRASVYTLNSLNASNQREM